MSKKLLGVVLAAATLAAPIALAGEGEVHGNHAPAKPTFKTITVAQVAALQKEKKVTVLDVNGADFRKQNGVVPGAVLISHFQKYDVAKELPAAKDQKLVFYCVNVQCSASHAAAQKAMEAGYTDVSVMSEGLLGWKKAGQPTAPYAPQS